MTLEQDELVLPTEVSDSQKNVSSMIIFGKHKVGKTTALSQLPNCLIIDTEKGTTNVKALKIEVPYEKGPVGKMQWLNKLIDKLVENCPYEYVALDTATEVNDWSEWSGTIRYMNSPQGKSFNREKDEKGNAIKDGEFLPPDDPEYMSVHTLGQGYGYRWSRDEFLRVCDKMLKIKCKCVFFICHVEDKYIGDKEKADGEAVTKQLALTGAIRNILPRRVGAIGYVYNDKGTIKINFTGSEEKVGGARADHLKGYNNVLDWSKIFI